METQTLNDTSRTTPLLAEQLLIDYLPEQLDRWRVSSTLLVTSGRGQAAEVIAVGKHSQSCDVWFIDLFLASLSRQFLAERIGDCMIDVSCSSDMPEKTFDLVALAVSKKAEAELTRDYLQQAHGQLDDGGRMVVAVDAPQDTWVHEQLSGIFSKVTRVPSEKGVIYSARKNGELKKVKDFWCEFPFRDECEKMWQLRTRPGVFSHRRLDAGARQLMRTCEIGPEDKVLDLGCGAGALALTASGQTGGTVYAVDCNARATQCTALSADANLADNVEVILNSDGELGLDGTIDLVLANPPYFGGDAIPVHFVETSIQVLRSGGALLVVNKKPSWYSEYFEGKLEDVAIFESGKYFIACGRKP